MRRRFVWAALALVGVAAIFAAGYGASALLDDDTAESVAGTPIVPTATRTRAPSITATPSLTVTPTVAPVVVAPTATPVPARQPEIEVLSLNPPLGAHIEQESVDISIDVRYQAGRDSNVLSWRMLYCAAPNDCNTYGGPALDILPGSSGVRTLGAPFTAGGNTFRPIVICRYTVEIGRFLTPESRWETQFADDPRCHAEAAVPKVRVTGVTPELGTLLNVGDTVSVNVEYDAGPATRLRARYFVENCTGDIFAFRPVDVAPGSSGIVTVLIPVTAQSTGPLRHIEAQLLNGETVIASYNFGPC
jgi:hypothetical protein